eukprot:gene44893-15886_t
MRGALRLLCAAAALAAAVTPATAAACVGGVRFARVSSGDCDDEENAASWITERTTCDYDSCVGDGEFRRGDRVLYRDGTAEWVAGVVGTVQAGRPLLPVVDGGRRLYVWDEFLEAAYLEEWAEALRDGGVRSVEDIADVAEPRHLPTAIPLLARRKIFQEHQRWRSRQRGRRRSTGARRSLRASSWFQLPFVVLLLPPLLTFPCTLAVGLAVTVCARLAAAAAELVAGGDGD